MTTGPDAVQLFEDAVLGVLAAHPEATVTTRAALLDALGVLRESTGNVTVDQILQVLDAIDEEEE